MSDIFITNLSDLNVKKVQDYLSWTTDHIFYNKNMSGGVQFIQSHLSQPNYWKYSTSVEVGLTCLVAGRLVLDSATENMLDEFPSNFSITKFHIILISYFFVLVH